MADAAKNPEKAPTLRDEIEKVSDPSFLRGHLVAFIKAEIKEGKMLSPDKWKENPAEAKNILDSVFNHFSDLKKYPQAAEYQKLREKNPEEFTKALADILVESEMASAQTKIATKEISKEVSSDFVSNTINRVGKNIEKLSKEGPTGYAKIAIYGFLAYKVISGAWNMLGDIIDPDKYAEGSWGRAFAKAGNLGILGVIGYGVYDNLLKDPKERGKGTQDAIAWARRTAGFEVVQPKGEAEAMKNLSKIPGAKDFLDSEATETFLATARIPAKDILHAYKTTETIGEIDPKFLWEGRQLTKSEKALAKKIDPEKLYAIIHSVINTFEPKAKENKMDILPYLEKEFVEKADIDRPVVFEQMVDCAAAVVLGKDKGKPLLAKKESPEEAKATPKAA
ncbi:MAG: hypothetical protein PHO48_00055 [Candidatus Gracilibacteria bacterium]|nr:hypothetical protein [Candidatus Gracilibacteria bacterium]MDD5178662.1 hypothetical protein [Candidatus Gracilibacteria bacterium]